MRGHRTSIWPTRRDLTGSYVRLDPDDEEKIQLVIPVPGTDRHTVTRISRNEARILARRINQCLDATVKR